MMGQRFIQLLDKHPNFKLELIFSSEMRAGYSYGEEVDWIIEGKVPKNISKKEILELDYDLLRVHDIDLVFSALPSFLPLDIEKEIALEGFPVFSSSATHRLDPDVPILVPEVNANHLDMISTQKTSPKGYIVTNPNCSTVGLSLSLKPLTIFGISRVYVSTYQALSGAGYPGPSSLSMMGNIIPFIRDEEEKIKSETPKVLGSFNDGSIKEPYVGIFPSCARVPVRDGHLLSVHVDLKEVISIQQAEEAFLSLESLEGLHSAPKKPIILQNDEDRPQPQKDVMAGNPVPGMSITVGRIRNNGDVLSYMALVHNTIRGGAGNAILSAELARREKYLGN